MPEASVWASAAIKTKIGKAHVARHQDLSQTPRKKEKNYKRLSHLSPFFIVFYCSTWLIKNTGAPREPVIWISHDALILSLENV